LPPNLSWVIKIPNEGNLYPLCHRIFLKGNKNTQFLADIIWEHLATKCKVHGFLSITNEIENQSQPLKADGWKPQENTGI
jgi:hypothetical protein